MNTNNNTIIEINYKDNAFDVLKIIGAYIVLFSHSFRHFDITKPTWTLFFTEGSIGVILFFAITGFVIMPAYERSMQKNHGLLTFYWNRIIRIFPPVLFSFLVITIINYLMIHVNVFTISYLIYAVKYCIFARGGYGDNGISNGVLWTIVPDIVYYLFTPLIYKIMKDKKTWVWIIVIVVFWQFNVWDKQLIEFLNTLPVLSGHIGASFSLCFMYEFLIGSFLYFKRNTIIRWFQKNKMAAYIILLAFTFLFEIYTYTDFLPKTGEMHTPWIGITVAPLAIIFGFVIKSIHLKVDLSFGIFLFHMIVVGVLKNMGISGAFGIIFTAATAPAVALLSNKLIEKPFARLKK